ncbi:MAG TPA: HNH endonuclease signature motif containing protein [Acidimicrobiia bacterium]
MHHIVHWSDGGPTDLDNLVLLCRRHHVDHHEGGWQIARAPDGSIVATPSVTQPFTRRRRRRRRG